MVFHYLYERLVIFMVSAHLLHVTVTFFMSLLELKKVLV